MLGVARPEAERSPARSEAARSERGLRGRNAPGMMIAVAAMILLACTATAALAQEPAPAQPGQPVAEAPTVDRSGEPIAGAQGSLGGSKAATAFFWALSA